jgi:hypothetical protein
MATIDTILFEQFVDAVNCELAAIGVTLRVTRAEPGKCGTMMLQDADGRMLGPVPDHVDAPTIKAFEAIITAPDAPQDLT